MSHAPLKLSSLQHASKFYCSWMLVCSMHLLYINSPGFILFMSSDNSRGLALQYSSNPSWVCEWSQFIETGLWIPYSGYKCSWFSLIKRVPRTFIPTNLVPHGLLFRKNESTKTFLKVFPRKFIPTKITRNMVVSCLSTYMYECTVVLAK